MDTRKINLSDIQDELTLCPYCMSPPRSPMGCCGESSAHFVKGYDLKIEEYVLADEVEVIDDSEDEEPVKSDRELLEEEQRGRDNAMIDSLNRKDY